MLQICTSRQTSDLGHGRQDVSRTLTRRHFRRISTSDAVIGTLEVEALGKS